MDIFAHTPSTFMHNSTTTDLIQINAFTSLEFGNVIIIGHIFAYDCDIYLQTKLLGLALNSMCHSRDQSKVGTRVWKCRDVFFQGR